jgi:hypothetical protein
LSDAGLSQVILSEQSLNAIVPLECDLVDTNSTAVSLRLIEIAPSGVACLESLRQDDNATEQHFG